jgi:hypothetical protein
MFTIITSPATTPVGLLIVRGEVVAVADVAVPRCAIVALAVEAPKSTATSISSDGVRKARGGEKRKAERGVPHSTVRTPHFAADGDLGTKSCFFIAPVFISSLPRRQLISG